MIQTHVAATRSEDFSDMIQTHVAATRSEEIQIKGRTARQGDKGSWSMLLHKDKALLPYCLDEQRLQHLLAAQPGPATNQAIWSDINGKREELNAQLLQRLVAFVAANQRTHAAAVDFSRALLGGNADLVRSYLRDCNRYTRPRPPQGLCFCATRLVPTPPVRLVLLRRCPTQLLRVA
jgi:hypothetical protein